MFISAIASERSASATTSERSISRGSFALSPPSPARESSTDLGGTGEASHSILLTLYLTELNMSEPVSIPTASGSASISTAQNHSNGGPSSPRSLRSVSSTNSPPPNLDTDSLALLSQFRSQKAKQQAKFARLEAKAKREEQARKNGGKVEEDDEDDEEQGFAESEAWGDLERLAKIEAGEVLSDDEGPSEMTDGENNDDDDEDGIMTVDGWRSLVSEVSTLQDEPSDPIASLHQRANHRRPLFPGRIINKVSSGTHRHLPTH